MALEVQVLLDIALILVVAKIFGEIATRLKFSSLIGEILAGILLGPVLLIVHPNDFLERVASFGILFLLFLIGLHTRFDEFKKDIYKGSVLAVAGAIISFVAGFMIGFGVFNSFTTGIVLVVALFFAVLGFFFLILTVGSKFVSRFLDAFKNVKDEQIMLSIPLVVLFIVAFISEHVGIAGVIGAFLAGIAMNRSPLAESVIAPKIKTIGYGFFIPLFFAYSAVILDLGTLVNYGGMILLLVVAIAFSKILGCGFLGSIYGFSKKEQLMIGIGMIALGEYSILVAQIALTAGAISQTVYTIVIAVVLISIVMTPVLMRIVHKSRMR